MNSLSHCLPKGAGDVIVAVRMGVDKGYPMSALGHAKRHWPPGLSPTKSEAVPTWRAAYSDRTSALMALFCELAHDTFVSNQVPADQADAPTIAGAAGRSELKRRLEAGSFRLVQIFNKDQAFLAVREGHFAILAFRGTKGKELLDTDLNFRLVPLPGVSRVMVHCGFLEAFSRCKSEIEAAVNESVPSTLGLYITGHSLGGALAQIASAALNRDNLAACYTFGSPRVGTAGFDEQIKCPHYRVVNNWDLVPAFPLRFFRGYRHNGDPRLLTPKTSFALRRDRYASFLYSIAAVVLVRLRTRRLLINDDHMIWNYRKRLEEIAAARAPAPTTS